MKKTLILILTLMAAPWAAADEFTDQLAKVSKNLAGWASYERESARRADRESFSAAEAAKAFREAVARGYAVDDVDNDYALVGETGRGGERFDVSGLGHAYWYYTPAGGTDVLYTKGNLKIHAVDSPLGGAREEVEASGLLTLEAKDRYVHQGVERAEEKGAVLAFRLTVERGDPRYPRGVEVSEYRCVLTDDTHLLCRIATEREGVPGRIAYQAFQGAPKPRRWVP